MLWTIQRLVGSRTSFIVVAALVVTMTLFGMTRWFVNTIENRVIQEQETEQLRQDQRTREKIDEGLQRAPRNVDDAVEWLRNRQSGK